MSEFLVPPMDEAWPSLGPEVCDWMEASLVFGPGDLLGQPYGSMPRTASSSRPPTRSIRRTIRARAIGASTRSS